MVQDWTALQFAAPSARGKHDIALAAMGQARLVDPTFTQTGVNRLEHHGTSLKPSAEEKMSSNKVDKPTDSLPGLPAMINPNQAFGAILFIDHELRKDRTFLLWQP